VDVKEVKEAKEVKETEGGWFAGWAAGLTLGLERCVARREAGLREREGWG